MKLSGLILVFLAAILILPACKSQPNGGSASGGDERFTETEVRNMWVAPYTQRCVGESEMDCMLVSFSEKKPVQGEWELFYDGIKGFDYEKGNLYLLKVRIGKLKAQYIKQDASDREYILLEVLKKEGA